MRSAERAMTLFIRFPPASSDFQRSYGAATCQVVKWLMANGWVAKRGDQSYRVLLRDSAEGAKRETWNNRRIGRAESRMADLTWHLAS